MNTLGYIQYCQLLLSDKELYETLHVNLISSFTKKAKPNIYDILKINT